MSISLNYNRRYINIFLYTFQSHNVSKKYEICTVCNFMRHENVAVVSTLFDLLQQTRTKCYK